MDELRVELHTISRHLLSTIKGTHVADAFNYAHFHPIIFRCNEIKSHVDAQRLNSWAIIIFIWWRLLFVLLCANEMHCTLEWLAFRIVFKLCCAFRVTPISPPTERKNCMLCCIVFEPCPITHHIEKLCSARERTVHSIRLQSNGLCDVIERNCERGFCSLGYTTSWELLMLISINRVNTLHVQHQN